MLTIKEYLSPENKKAKDIAEKVYNRIFPPPKTHKEVIDKINLVHEIKTIIYR